jgi:hypothetical protein
MSKPLRSVEETGGDVAAAFGLLSSERWAQAKLTRLRDGSRVERRDEAPDGAVTIVVSREVPSGGPSYLVKFLPKDGRVVQTDSWDPPAGDTRTGVWTVAIPGVPAKLGGSMRLEPSGSGSRFVVDGEASVPLPLVGGKAEAYVAQMVQKLMAKEGEVLRSELGGG